MPVRRSMPTAPQTARGAGLAGALKGDSAGPEITRPSGENRDPWHGQSHVRSAAFHLTMHPR